MTKKIINGKRYDTDTARFVAEWENMYDCTDFHWYNESLYQKRNGEYFLFGEGGAMSKYNEATGTNSWSGGERIMPLTYDEAREWMEKHADADEYEAEFGEVSEDGEKAVISIRVPAKTKAALDRLAAKTGKTKGEIIAEALNGMEL